MDWIQAEPGYEHALAPTAGLLALAFLALVFIVMWGFAQNTSTWHGPLWVAVCACCVWGSKTAVQCIVEQ